MTPTGLTTLPERVKICEVGPRDGLQNESTPIATETKVRYVDLLTAAGFSLVETTSFVSPKAIPQLADAASVFSQIAKRDGVTYLVLTPNERGLDRAIEAGAKAVAVFTGATESFVQRNINMTIAESLAAQGAVVKRARAAGMWVRAYVSTAFGCPYEGAVAVDAVVRVSEALAEMGVDELSIGDTIGVATPNQVVDVTGALQEHLPIERLAMHFHDTRGTALANVLAALQMGVTTFDSSAGGLGGCPYAPGASGNLATEDLVYLLHGMGIATGVDLDALRAASRFIAGALGHPLSSRTFAALEAADAR